MKAWFTFVLLFCLSALSAETKGFLSADEIALFFKQGYLLKRQALDKTEMQRLKIHASNLIDRALNEVLAASSPIFSEDEQIMIIDGSNVVFKRRPDLSTSICRVRGISGMEPDLLTTVRSEKMLHTFFEILGTTELEHIISQIHPKLPGDRIAFPKHRDIQFRKAFDPEWQDILGNGSYAICIIPIDPMSPANGGLWVDKNNYPEPQGLEPDIEWLYTEPGDILFMHPYLFHGSEANMSLESRKMLLTGFCAFGANHKAYPGAHVNAHIILGEDNQITIIPSPWSKEPSVIPGVNH